MNPEDLVACKQCGLVYNKKNVSEWDGSEFKGNKLVVLKCVVCNTYTKMR